LAHETQIPDVEELRHEKAIDLRHELDATVFSSRGRFQRRGSGIP